MSIRLSGLVSNMDTDSIVQSLMSAQRLKLTKIENKKTKLEWKQEEWKDLNTKLYSFYKTTLSDLRFSKSYTTKNATSSDESVATVTASSTAPTGTHSLKVKQLASSEFVTGGQLTADENSKAVSTSTKLTDLNMTSGNVITVTAGTTTETLTISDTTTVSDFLSTLQDAGLNASFDTTQQRFFISSEESGSDNAFTLTATTSSELAGLKLNEIKKGTDGTYQATQTTAETTAGVTYSTIVQPQDADYIYNGVEMTSSSNNITVNGLSITLLGVTDFGTTDATSDDEVVNLSVTNDTDAVYDTIKSFITSYNELLEEMNTYYYADTASGYEPLTDDEKASMTDDQITKWEEKIKDSLLRRDDSLGTVISEFRSNLSGSVKVGTKSYSLASFGIATSSDWTERGLLHIDGDPDDSTTSSEDDKLKAALSSDPDAVYTVISKLATNLYTSMTNNMKTSSIRSALNFYNDKEMTKQLDEYDDDIDEMEDKLSDMEDRYYEQFTAMETAMANLNSQSSALSSLTGSSS